MSSYEYKDLFIKSQENPNAPYHIFCFDIISSEKMDDLTRKQADIDSLWIINNLYNILHKKELIEHKNILINKEELSNCLGGLPTEPFIFGDMVGLTILKDSIPKEEVLAIFNHLKAMRKIDFEFHYNDAYYETNNYAEGHDKLFRGYCIDLLSNLHKPYNQNLRKALINNRKILKKPH